MRGLSAHRWPVGAPAHVHVLRTRRLLRQLPQPSRHRPLPRRPASAHPVLRTRRGLVVLLHRRARVHRRRRAVVRAPMTAAGDHAADGAWPALTLATWTDTRDTLHMWIQVVGKIRMALTPLINHWWNVPLYVSARGLTTTLMHTGGRGIEIEFDFIDHRLELRTSDGAQQYIALEPRSV